MQPGLFISIEGSEGAGKTTAKQCITEYLQEHHIEFIATREPGGTVIAEAIREILLSPQTTETITPITELLLMFASRSQHLQNVILPALQVGKWVVSDRFVDASYAYQGGGRQIDLLSIELLDKWVVAGHYPDLTLLLDLPPELGMMRIKSRGDGGKDRIENEKITFFNHVRDAYLARANADPERIKIIDASQSPEKVAQQIRMQLALLTKRVAT